MSSQLKGGAMNRILAYFLIGQVIVLSVIGLIDINLMAELWARALVGVVLIGILIQVARSFMK